MGLCTQVNSSTIHLIIVNFIIGVVETPACFMNFFTNESDPEDSMLSNVLNSLDDVDEDLCRFKERQRQYYDRSCRFFYPLYKIPPGSSCY